MSLDGVIAPMDGWFDPNAAADALLAVNVEHREAADALVVGRVTYEEFGGFWPAQTDDPTGTARYLDRVAKYVVTSTELSTDGANTTRLPGPTADELAALKQHSRAPPSSSRAAPPWPPRWCPPDWSTGTGCSSTRWRRSRTTAVPGRRGPSWTWSRLGDSRPASCCCSSTRPAVDLNRT